MIVIIISGIIIIIVVIIIYHYYYCLLLLLLTNVSILVSQVWHCLCPKETYIVPKGFILVPKALYIVPKVLYIVLRVLYIYIGTARRYFYSTCMHTWIHSFAARIKASVLHGRWKTRGVNRNLWARFWVDEKEFTMYNILVHIFIHLPLSLYICIHTHTHIYIYIYIYTYISGGAVACLSYNLCSRTYVLPVVLCGHGHDHVYWFAVQRLGCGQIMSHSCQGRVSHNHREHSFRSSELLDVHIPVLVGGWWPLEFTEKLYPNGVPVKHCLLAVASGLPWRKLQHLTCCTLAFSQDFCAGTAIVPLLILDDPSLSPIDPTICIYMYPIEHGSWDVASEKLSGDG
jgi:hypothetical protein